MSKSSYLASDFSLFLQAVNQLCSHFEAYRDVPKITELREKFKNIKKILKSHVFSDFTRCANNELDKSMKEDIRFFISWWQCEFWPPTEF